MKKRIAIHSVPRSGSTWLGAIMDSHPSVIYKYQPLFSYALKGYLTSESGKDEILSFFNKLEFIHDPFLDQKESKERNIIPVFNKETPEAIVYKEVRYHNILSNIMAKDGKLKVIGLIRNPLSTLFSWYTAPKEFRRDLGWDFEKEWRFAYLKNEGRKEEFNGYEKWKEVALLFESLNINYPDRFYLLMYSDLIKETELNIKKLFDFIDLPYHSQTQNFIKDSRKNNINDSYGVYKIKSSDDQWKYKLPENIVDYIIHDLKGTVLEKYLQ